MSKARDLADLIAVGSTIEVADISDLTSDAAELNTLDGITSTVTELNKLTGVTAVAADLNILDGVTSTTAELNKLTGVTSTTAELNKLTGVTSTTTELNHVAGVTSDIQTQLGTKMTPTYTGDVDVTGELTVDSYNETYAAVTSTTNATTVDCEAGNTFMHTLTETTTFTFSNPPATGTGYTMSIEIIQDAGATGLAVTWPASVDWPAATAPTLTATASAVDVFIFTTRDGGTIWYGFTAGQALA
jgi:hypothetical protein